MIPIILLRGVARVALVGAVSSHSGLAKTSSRSRLAYQHWKPLDAAARTAGIFKKHNLVL